MSRFSKQTLTEELQKAIDAIQTEWGFDITNGTVQIEPVAEDRMKTNPIDNGLGTPRDRVDHMRHALMDYGRLQALQDLAVLFDLAVSYVPVGHDTRRKIGPIRNHMIRYVSDAQAQYALAAKRRSS